MQSLGVLGKIAGTGVQELDRSLAVKLDIHARSDGVAIRPRSPQI